MTLVSIIDTGVANTASVCAAFERMGVHTELILDVENVQRAELLVLPGVGSFGAGMQRLRERRLDRALIERVQDNRPTLAICLGLQLLCTSSDESPGVEGLAILDQTISAFPENAQRPQFGWNRVEADPDCRVLESGDAYFANSYKLDRAPEGWTACTTTHVVPFISALERGRVVACQFHPELSGAWGASILQRWVTLASEGTPCSPNA